jgi:hypothetical protein
MQPYDAGTPNVYGQAPGPARPGSPKVLGIISIVFGSVILLTSVFGILASGVIEIDIPGAERAFEQFMQETRSVSIAQSGAFAVMSLLLLAIGIGQLGYRRWAARASVIWGIAGLVILVGVAVIHFTVIGPATDRMVAQLPSDFGGGKNPFTAMGFFGGLISLLLYAPYPIVLIATFTRPHVVAAMKY